MVDYSTLSIVLTGIGVMVAFTYYAMNLRTSNKARKGQLLMQAFARLDSPGRIQAVGDMLGWEFETFDEFMERYGPETEHWDSLSNVHLFFEGLGPLVRHGHLDSGYVASLIGGALGEYWKKMSPIKEEMKEYLYPRWCAETEYLYGEVVRYWEEHPEREC